MTDILIDWLNCIPLSTKVQALDDSFSNGFMIGEILHYHNQINNFSSYIDKSSPDAQINNMCLLNQSLHCLSVHFDTNIATKIVNGDRIALGTLLFEIRTKLNALKQSSVPVASTERFRGGKLPLLSAYTKPVKVAYNDAANRIFERRLREISENPNNQMLEKVTQKFRDEGSRAAMNATILQNLEVEEVERNKLDDCQRNRLERRQKRRAMEVERDFHEKIWESTLDLARKRKSRVAKFSQTCNSTLRTMHDKHVSKLEQEAIMSCNSFEASHPDFCLGDDDFDTDEIEMSKSSSHLENLAISVKTAGDVIPGYPAVECIDNDALDKNFAVQMKEIESKKYAAASSSLARHCCRSKYLIGNEKNLTDAFSAECNDVDDVHGMNQLFEWHASVTHTMTDVLNSRDAIEDNVAYFKTQISDQEKIIDENKECWRADEEQNRVNVDDYFQSRSTAFNSKIVQGKANINRYASIDICSQEMSRLLSLVDNVIDFRFEYELNRKRNESSQVLCQWNHDILPPLAEFDVMKACKNEIDEYINETWFGKWKLGQELTAENKGNEEEQEETKTCAYIGNVARVSSCDALGEVVADIKFLKHLTQDEQKPIGIDHHNYMLCSCSPVHCADNDKMVEETAVKLNLKLLSVSSFISSRLNSNDNFTQELIDGNGISDMTIVNIAIDLIRSFDDENKHLHVSFDDSTEKLKFHLESKKREADAKDRIAAEVEEYKQSLMSMDEFYDAEVNHLVAEKKKMLLAEVATLSDDVCLSKQPYDGWIFCDFPRNSDQIVQFVKSLSKIDISKSPVHKYDFKSSMASVSTHYHAQYDLSLIPIGPFLFLKKQIEIPLKDAFRQQVLQSSHDSSEAMMKESLKIDRIVNKECADVGSLIDEVERGNQLIRDFKIETQDKIVHNPQALLFMETQWSDMEAVFRHDVITCLDAFKNLSNHIFQRQSNVRNQLRSYYSRLDSKQEILDSFLSDIRSSIQSEDLMFDTNVMNETLIRIDSLRINLLNECQKRLSENTTKLKDIAGDAWMNNAMIMIDSVVASLCQAEYYRLQACCRILADYQVQVCMSKLYPDMDCQIIWLPAVNSSSASMPPETGKKTKPAKTASKSKLKDKTSAEAEEMFEMMSVAQSLSQNPVGVSPEWFEQKGFQCQPCIFFNHIYKILGSIPSEFAYDQKLDTTSDARNAIFVDHLTAEKNQVQQVDLFPHEFTSDTNNSRVMSKAILDYVSKLMEATAKISKGGLVAPSDELVSCVLSAAEIESLKGILGETEDNSVCGKFIAGSVLKPIYAAISCEAAKFKRRVYAIVSFGCQLQRVALDSSRELFQELLEESYNLILSEEMTVESAIESMQKSVMNSEVLSPDMKLQGNSFVSNKQSSVLQSGPHAESSDEPEALSGKYLEDVLSSDTFLFSGSRFVAVDQVITVLGQLQSHPLKDLIVSSKIKEIMDDLSMQNDFANHLPVALTLSGVNFISFQVLLDSLKID